MGAAWHGQQLLWLAVLCSAIEDLAASEAIYGPQAVRLRILAQMWIRSKDSDVGSFNFVCRVLGCEPALIRKAILVKNRQRLDRGAKGVRRLISRFQDVRA